MTVKVCFLSLYTLRPSLEKGAFQQASVLLSFYFTVDGRKLLFRALMAHRGSPALSYLLSPLTSYLNTSEEERQILYLSDLEG